MLNISNQSERYELLHTAVKKMSGLKYPDFPDYCKSRVSRKFYWSGMPAKAFLILWTILREKRK